MENKIYKRTVLNIRKNTNTVEQTNFKSFILTTEKGEVVLRMGKGYKTPVIGQIITFTDKNIRTYANADKKYLLNVDCNTYCVPKPFEI